MECTVLCCMLLHYIELLFCCAVFILLCNDRVRTSHQFCFLLSNNSPTSLKDSTTCLVMVKVKIYCIESSLENIEAEMKSILDSGETGFNPSYFEVQYPSKLTLMIVLMFARKSFFLDVSLAYMWFPFCALV